MFSGLAKQTANLAVGGQEAPHKGSKLECVRYSAGLGVMSVAEIRLQEGESLANALRRFKRKVMTEDIIKDVKRHSYYLKPGERRRVKQALAQKRARKKLRKDSDQVAPRRGAAAK
jgi:small subunit ribosomal protein S21